VSQPPRQPDSADGLGSDDTVLQRPRTGGRVAGQAYAPSAPATAGSGYAWPFRDYTGAEPRQLREAYQWWQAIVGGSRPMSPTPPGSR
jgi:hypothetical protein